MNVETACKHRWLVCEDCHEEFGTPRSSPTHDESGGLERFLDGDEALAVVLHADLTLTTETARRILARLAARLTDNQEPPVVPHVVGHDCWAVNCERYAPHPEHPSE